MCKKRAVEQVGLLTDHSVTGVVEAKCLGVRDQPSHAIALPRVDQDVEARPYDQHLELPREPLQPSVFPASGDTGFLVALASGLCVSLASSRTY